MFVAVEFFQIALAAHIAAVMITFGGVFAYPLVSRYYRKSEPRSLPVLHRVQALVGKRLITPGLAVILVLGIYLASKEHVWSEAWVTVPLIILIALGGLGGAYFGPQETRAGALAARDIAASPAEGDPVFSAEYEALFAQIGKVQLLGMALVLVAVYFMTVKPFA